MAAKGSFQGDQTAKARLGYRVQSLPKDMAARISLMTLPLRTTLNLPEGEAKQQTIP